MARPRRRLAFIALCVLAGLGAGTFAGSRVSAPEQPPRTAIELGPQLAFEPDAGGFVSRASGMTLSVGDRGSAVAVGTKRRAVVRTTLVGGRAVEPEAAQRLRGVVNSYVGPRSRWRTGVPTYAQVRSPSVYPGVDLLYHGREGRLEYDFALRPHADPGTIAMRIAGARSLRLDSRGDLLIDTAAGTLRHLRPVALQDGRRIRAAFALDGETVRFRLGRYDRARPLVIDPVLAYSTYNGTGKEEYDRDAAIDGAGNLYAAGQVNNGTDVNPNFDAVVTKLAPDGKSRAFTTYFGGSDTDGADGVGVDALGYVFIGGNTQSTDLPGRTTGFQPAKSTGLDGYVAKLGPDGALIRSTYTGGNGEDYVFGLALDGSGNAYVTGQSYSTNIASAGVVQTAKAGTTMPDAYVTKFSSSLQTRSYSTYVGGANRDYAHAIAVGPDGSAYVTGITYSNDFPLNNPADPVFWDTNAGAPPPSATEAFVTRLNPTATARTFSTYMGGNGQEQGYGIAVDSAGRAYVAGETGSANTLVGGFPYSSPPVQDDHAGGSADAMLLKFQADGTLDYAGWYGGSGTDIAYGVDVDAEDNAYYVGRTQSSNLTVTANIPQPSNANPASADAFAIKVNTGLGLIFATYLGGAGFDSANAAVVDGNGSLYVVGDTQSDDLPISDGAVQPDRGGGSDGWLFKLALATPSISGPEGTIRSPEATFTFDAAETSPTFKCRLAPGEASFSSCSKTGKTYSGLADGNYTFEVAVVDRGGTTGVAAQRNFTVDTRPIAQLVVTPNPALVGLPVNFDGSASSGAGQPIAQYEWDLDGDGAFERNTGTTPTTTATYPAPRSGPVSMRVTDAIGASAIATAELRVNTLPSTGTQFGVTINKGARYTNDPDVTVGAVFPATTTSLLFSNDGGFLAPTRFAPQASVKWRLDSSGPERLPKTIYVRFLAGAIVGETFQDDIILDETPPKVRQASVAPVGAASARTAGAAALRRWKVRVRATDSNSGVARIQVTANKRKPGRLLRYKRRLRVRSAKRPRWVRARDAAGNYSRWRRAR